MSHRSASAEADGMINHKETAEFDYGSKAEILRELEAHVEDALEEEFPAGKKDRLKIL